MFDIDVTQELLMKRILFIVPPNVAFDDFVNPPGNVKVAVKGSRRFGAVIADPPLGVRTCAATQPKLLDFNVQLNRLDTFGSFLYQCTLAGSLNGNLRRQGEISKPGEWAWHGRCPANIITVHETYRGCIAPEPRNLDAAARQPESRTENA